jgi:hypothetical protein
MISTDGIDSCKSDFHTIPISTAPSTAMVTLYNKMLTSSRSVLFLGTSVPSTKRKTDYQDITEILLKVALNTITLTPLSGNPDFDSSFNGNGTKT